MREEIWQEQVNLPTIYHVASPCTLHSPGSYICILKYTGVRTKTHPQNTLFCAFRKNQKEEKLSVLSSVFALVIATGDVKRM
jgi:hypothetical protein